MNSLVPSLLDKNLTLAFPACEEREMQYIGEARGLFESGYYSYSLLAIWNASVNNLKRRVEAYSVDLWNAVVKDEPGRKKFDKDGATISERWSGVDDLVLIAGATRLGLLNPKAGKALEMINWMRNHASPAHDSDHRVEKEDVIALALILQRNLFDAQLPDPGHSIGGLFDPVKKKPLSADEFEILVDQIKSLRAQDLRICFGFFLEQICLGLEPGLTNSRRLFVHVWERVNDDLKRTLGIKFHSLFLDPSTDESADKGAATRLLETLIGVKGIQFVPDGTRARLFRRAAASLAAAKDTSYGWASEEAAAKTLAQLGVSVPSVAFEEVYQEIFAVWCGNYWGRSGSNTILSDFIAVLGTDQLRVVMKMFRENSRVRNELSQSKAKGYAIELLNSLMPRLTIEAHKEDLRNTITNVMEI